MGGAFLGFIANPQLIPSFWTRAQRPHRRATKAPVGLSEVGSEYVLTTLNIPAYGHYNDGGGKVSYVRAKRRGNRIYYYLVESRREGKKVRQRVIRYLGTKPPTKQDLETILRRIQDEKNKL